jgi:hypothetical protein
MPRDKISNHPGDEARVEVGWQRGGDCVQITTATDAGDGSSVSCWLDSRALTRLRRALLRADTQAFGPAPEDLRDDYGQPEPFDAATALELLGLSQKAQPAASTAAFRYPSMEAAQAYAAGNLRHHGHETIGPAETEQGVIAVTVLKPAG